MNLISLHPLSALLWSPLIGAFFLCLIPAQKTQLMKIVAFLSSLIPLTLALTLFHSFQGTGDFEFRETIQWIPEYNVYYRLGVDGLSLPMIVLSTLLVPLIVLAGWKDVQKNVRFYLILFFLLEVGMIGVFSATDLLLFYVFWEAQLIPMYFLIGMWGGDRRIYAALKFVLYTMFGSLLMLAAILALYYLAGKSFSLYDYSSLNLPLKTQMILFSVFTFAFCIKVPVFPLHTWLPDAHVEAPTAGSVILAGVLLKMGTYGLIRFSFPLFPLALHEFTPLLKTLAVIGIIYGSLVAMVQPDIKKLVAYTSVAHLGYVVLGFLSGNTQGMMGANLQSINHGISTGALFLLVGMIYERRHTRKIADFGGIAKVMPLYTILFLIVTLSSIALPTTNGFVGEFLILIGTFKSSPRYAAFAGTGVVFGAIAMLWMFQRVFWGKITHEENKELKDLSFRECFLILPLIVLIFLIGLNPGFLMNKMEKSISKLQSQMMSTDKQPLSTLESIQAGAVPTLKNNAGKGQP